MTATGCTCPDLPDLIAAAMHGEQPVCAIHNPPAATEPHGNPSALNNTNSLRNLILEAVHTQGETTHE
ncbi:hypothetical protein GCM10011492_06670 [Flexivirga endophytica]|uniref:Uncharacterized protein n=1 Tax=Flexivirga endophytica TaxID=1849103 RepID=A0A916SWP4_9MICO|nr:hypothetical protein [Flexivirga endophytica]GGB19497.1 hypothetical protein GCM10011492_06670 [Flexivirga endophytica]GHB36203.1 hypothetical protein GCM10008112_00940 [Flexivirga endophytica]